MGHRGTHPRPITLRQRRPRPIAGLRCVAPEALLPEKHVAHVASVDVPRTPTALSCPRQLCLRARDRCVGRRKHASAPPFAAAAASSTSSTAASDPDGSRSPRRAAWKHASRTQPPQQPCSIRGSPEPCPERRGEDVKRGAFQAQGGSQEAHCHRPPRYQVHGCRDRRVRLILVGVHVQQLHPLLLVMYFLGRQVLFAKAEHDASVGHFFTLHIQSSHHAALVQGNLFPRVFGVQRRPGVAIAIGVDVAVAYGRTGRPRLGSQCGACDGNVTRT
mmetsp:Transcript_3002/g.4798  ORF Transcript_3002/g.4798 Transcript_3002/m.4798 type:complete len:274 (-) Transcript_3002:156-977(-)